MTSLGWKVDVFNEGSHSLNNNIILYSELTNPET